MIKQFDLVLFIRCGHSGADVHTYMKAVQSCLVLQCPSRSAYWTQCRTHRNNRRLFMWLIRSLSDRTLCTLSIINEGCLDVFSGQQSLYDADPASAGNNCEKTWWFQVTLFPRKAESEARAPSILIVCGFSTVYFTHIRITLEERIQPWFCSVHSSRCIWKTDVRSHQSHFLLPIPTTYEWDRLIPAIIVSVSYTLEKFHMLFQLPVTNWHIEDGQWD